MLGLAVVAGAAWVVCLRQLLGELHSRRTLTRADGVVERVEFSRAGHPTGSRATIAFVDRDGQQRRFTTAWAETPYSAGATVPVGYRPGVSVPPRPLRTQVLAGHIALTVLTGALTAASLFVVGRVWLARP